ncbi:hypothetical protein IMSAGC009_03542 [Lachnospiraceae bacterium]|jgi:hypothetical protein|nr:hypothetical protein IMSAGC009_03542 [Lachnospiraceae bacterium]
MVYWYLIDHVTKNRKDNKGEGKIGTGYCKRSQ